VVLYRWMLAGRKQLLSPRNVGPCFDAAERRNAEQRSYTLLGTPSKGAVGVDGAGIDFCMQCRTPAAGEALSWKRGPILLVLQAE
jgi:hypothetical protein